MRPRILVIAPAMCRSDKNAGDLRLERVIEQLVTFATVDFLTPEDEPEGQGAQRRPWDTLRARGVTVVNARFAARLPMWCRSRRHPYDWIIVEFWYLADRLAMELEFIHRDSPRTRVAIDTVDVHFLRERAALERGAADYGSEAEVAARERREIATYRRADLLIACTREDAAALLATCPEVPTAIVPIVMPSRERSEHPRGHSLLFIGGFRHSPNVDAVLWLVREIVPLVRDRMPDVVFHVVGSDAPPEIEALCGTPGVEIVGYVAHTAEWLDRAVVSVAPLRYGAGMKGKVAEALAAAVPVVTTSIGAQGLGARSGEHLYIADDAGDFAAAVVTLLSDPDAAGRMGLAGQALVDSICGPAVVRGALEAAFTPGERLAGDAPGGNLRRILASVRCKLWILRGWVARMTRAV